MTNAPSFRLGYRRWLDGLRGVAILMVLAFHLGLLPGGSLGVDVFFVLSGFLITTLLVEEWERRGAIRLRSFYLRRALRLLPAFIVLLFICGLSSFLLPTAKEAAVRQREVMVAACYVANWPGLHHTGMPLLGHTWSLSVEEQFYLVWPAILCLMLRLKLPRRRILLLVIAGILLSASLRMVLYRLHRVPGPENWANVSRLYMGSDTRADALLVGCLVGLSAAWGLLPKSRDFALRFRIVALVSAAGLGYMSWASALDHSQYYHGLFTLVALMVAAILVRQLTAPGRANSLLESAPLVGIGRISYALYLFHMPILSWLKPMGRGLAAPGGDVVGDRPHSGRRPALVLLRGAPLPPAEGPAAGRESGKLKRAIEWWLALIASESVTPACPAGRAPPGSWRERRS